ncbi:MAG TPA: hypothetical protein PKM67_03005 [Kiritimatiellia bacterium]|nr:hypothetical protein [Kiritimatiellia bacterium]HPA78660.1 hypothetical protein [Kiritimatiellia bacterium]
MAKMKRQFIPNQVFVGLPWKNVRPRYERIITSLNKKYPLHFTIVGRDDGQNAVALFEVIKDRIASSSYAIFDATGGNANVSLEYGYAEGIEVPRSLFLSSHKAARKASAGDPIISDLIGMRRVPYKTESVLSKELNSFSRNHDFTKRFEKALFVILKGKIKGKKKSGRALALKIIHSLGGKSQIRRAELIQHFQAQSYEVKDIETMLKGLHQQKIVKCSVGKYSDVNIA